MWGLGRRPFCGRQPYTYNLCYKCTLVIADAAYPIREWLMKPYGRHMDDRKVHFDKCFSSARNVVESKCAFRCLKQHWCCLFARLPKFEKNVIAVICLCSQPSTTSVRRKVTHVLCGWLHGQGFCPISPYRRP